MEHLHEFIVPWTMEGETKIRARSATEARAKFDATLAEIVAKDHHDIEVHGVKPSKEWDRAYQASTATGVAS